MKTQPEISQVFFDAMLDEAIEDLCRSGLSRDEIIGIIEKQFGIPYARRFREFHQGIIHEKNTPAF